MDPQNIRNIIFDLGGVILNIDYHRTTQSFIDLGITNFNELYSQFHADRFFEDFEKGMVEEATFIQKLKSHVPAVSEKDILTSWNAMLLDFPARRINFLMKLKSKYRTFLLSNTNVIHHRAFQNILLDTTGTLNECFEKAYYSHELGLRKPDKEIFQLVLAENKLLPEETLFFDDTLANIDTARLLKLQVHYVKPGERMEELLREF